MTFDPAGVALVVVLGVLYARAVTVLRWRGWRVPRSQQALWWSGVALLAFAFVGPPDALSDDLVSAHMAQHLLLADLAAPFLLAGVRTPVIVFLLPRPLLVPLARCRPLRDAFAVLRRPLVALPLWVLTLYGWHLGFAFEGALRHPLVHMLQHQAFFVTSVLVWWSVVEPQRARSRGELWKIGHLIGTRVAGMFLGMAFILMRTQAYGWYGDRARLHGMDPLLDQQIGGGLMMLTDLLVMLFALGFFFWRAAADEDRARAAEQRAAMEQRDAAEQREAASLSAPAVRSRA